MRALLGTKGPGGLAMSTRWQWCISFILRQPVVLLENDFSVCRDFLVGLFFFIFSCDSVAAASRWPSISLHVEVLHETGEGGEEHALVVHASV